MNNIEIIPAQDYNRIFESMKLIKLGVAADVVTLGTNAIEDEPYTAKGLRKLKEGFDETMED